MLRVTCGYFWPQAGNFGNEQVLSVARGYFWGHARVNVYHMRVPISAGTFGCAPIRVGIFAHAWIILVERKYFRACMGSFGRSWELLDAHGYFWA